MKFKEGVDSTRITPELIIALVIADFVWKSHGQDLVITSLNDSKHSRTSLHYSGQAADLRSRYFTAEEKRSVATDLEAALGHSHDYDVVVENDHIHLEWQPKGS